MRQRRVIQRKPAPGLESAPAGATQSPLSPAGPSPESEGPDLSSIARHGVSSPGQALGAETRGIMDSHLGHDFSQVRIHTDAAAAESARRLGAEAFTLGPDIAFGAGRFAPDSPAGQRLLAHELAHVAQQGPGPAPPGSLPVSRPGDAIEAAAGDAADRVAGGEPVRLQQTAAPGVYGSWLGDAGAAIGDLVGDLTNTRPDEARLDAQEDLARFMGQHFEKKNHHPSTGRGLFDVTYDPATGNMVVTLKICFQFTSGDPTDPIWLAAVGAAAAGFKAEEFVWQPGEADEWKGQAKLDVESAWSQQYTFHSTKPFWDALPDVNVAIAIVEAPAAEAHYVTTVRKWPKDAGVLDAVMPPGAANQSTAQFEESSDNGIRTPDVDTITRTTASQPEYARVDTDNPGVIFFSLGKSEVSGTDRAALKKFGQTLARPEIPPFPVTLTGRASSEGSDESNLKLSEDRAREVSNIIVAEGAKTQPAIVPQGEAGASASPGWRRVEITVGVFTSQQETVRHEFGHMLGLGDEYPNPGSGRPAGTPVAHSALAQRLIPGQQPVVATDNADIMSCGENIQPHHYVTFLEVLGLMTKTEGQWSVGPGRGKPKGPGDFPAPSGRTQTA